MKERAVVAFSGVSTRVVDRAAAKLSANGIDPAVVLIGDSGPDRGYFDRLLAQTLAVVAHSATRTGVTPTAFLVSGVADQGVRLLEDQAFFPALRRVAIDPAWRNNPAASDRIADAALAYLQSPREKAFVRSVSVRRDARLLLPVVNSRSKALAERFSLIYEREVAELEGRVDRDVTFLRKRKCYRINGVDFAPTENSGKHPVRRCSPTHRCDLEATFRFGAPVPERVEFDVSCENGLRNKTFRQCDGTSASFNGDPGHVNMRINGDFRFG